MNDENKTPEAFEEDDEYTWLTDEEGIEHQCLCWDRIGYNGDEYLVLEPMDEEDDGIVILQVEPSDEEEDGETYYTVEDDSILDAVFQLFRKRNPDLFDD